MLILNKAFEMEVLKRLVCLEISHQKFLKSLLMLVTWCLKIYFSFRYNHILPYFMKTPYIANSPFFKFCPACPPSLLPQITTSNALFVILFFWLNGWLHHVLFYLMIWWIYTSLGIYQRDLLVCFRRQHQHCIQIQNDTVNCYGHPKKDPKKIIKRGFFFLFYKFLN